MQTIEGIVYTHAHRIAYAYSVPNNLGHHSYSDLNQGLEAEAESRASYMISQGYVAGELNYVYDEQEIRGWWEINEHD